MPENFSRLASQSALPYYQVVKASSPAKRSVSYVAVNSLNTEIITATRVKNFKRRKIGWCRVTSIIIDIWNARSGNLVKQLERPIASHTGYPVPRFSQCGTLIGLPLRHPSKPGESTVEFIDPKTGDSRKTVPIPATIVAIALSQKRLAVSIAEHVTTSPPPNLTKGSKGSHEIDRVYGKNLRYLDGERYVLAVVQRRTPQRLEH